MKRILLLGVAWVAVSLLVSCQRKDCVPCPNPAEEAVMGVISRTLGRTPDNVRIRIEPAPKDYYETEVRSGVLRVTAGSPTAACRGFYDWIGAHHLGLFTESVCTVRLPRRLEDEPPVRRESAVELRYFLSECSYGYTYPYWTWKEWERELDRLALHGVNLIPAPTGTEAIAARVWEKLGLSREEADSSTCGPAHLPWYRAGNVHALDSGLSEHYLQESVALQHRILDRMRPLGMEPIFMGFRGFVPDALKKRIPEAEVGQMGWNYGHPDYRTSFLAPQTGLFQQIAASYYEELRAEFGAFKYVMCNCFSEMKIPFAPQGTPERERQMADFGRMMYRTIGTDNPDAVWVLSGWMFGFDKKTWDAASVRAMLSGVPDDKMLILDLATDTNFDSWEIPFTFEYCKGFFGKHWIYCTMPNYGGRNIPVGNLEYYLNGHLTALQSPHRGHLSGFGSAPEGVENNEVLYEMILSAPWHTERRDLRAWLREYTCNRYGVFTPELEAYWEGLLAADYSFYSNKPQYCVMRRPFDPLNGRYDVSPAHFRALESFVAAGKDLRRNPVYRQDLAFWMGLYALGKADLLAREVDRAYKTGDTTAAVRLRARFTEAMLASDRFFETHPLTRLDRWISQARRLGATPEEKDRLEVNARRMVTIWGPFEAHPVRALRDYSARAWSGLIRDYYLPRWQHAFDARQAGTAFDFDTWEQQFATQVGTLSRGRKYRRILPAARSLVRAYADVQERDGELPGWHSMLLGDGTQRFSYRLRQADYLALEGLEFQLLSGADTVLVDRIRIRGNKETVLDQGGVGLVLSPQTPVTFLRLDRRQGGPHKNMTLDVYVRAGSAVREGIRTQAGSGGALTQSNTGDAGALTDAAPKAAAPDGSIRSNAVIRLIRR